MYCLYSGEPTDNCCEIDKIDISIASAGKIKDMKFKDNLTIRVGCEKYELILDTEHKKSFVGTMLSHCREYGIER